MAPNHGADTLGSILGRMGSHWVQKMGQNRKKLPCPKIRIFDYSAVIDFSQKMEVTVMAQITVVTPWGPSWGQWGPIGSKKWVKTVKKLPCPKIRIFDYAAVIDFSQKMEVMVMAPNHGGEPLGSILGSMGSHWVQENGSKTVKNYHDPKFEFSTTPRSLIFRKKWKLRLWRKLRWWPPRVHLGANGVPLGPKNGSKPSKITMPKNSNFRLPRVHRFFTKNESNGYGAKSRLGPPRVHFGANGVPLVPKNGLKP